MLKTRVVPTLLLSNHGLVKGVSFNSWRRIGTLLPAIKVYKTRDVDELVLLDIRATLENRGPDLEMIKEISAECSFPFTVGGGVSDAETIRQLLLAGADKVVINSAAYSNPELLREAAYRFGAQCIVGGIDFQKSPDQDYECLSHCGKKRTGKRPWEWARQLEEMGAGELLLTSIDRDGTMSGFELEVIQRVCQTVDIPVIAAGGAGKPEDFLKAIQSGAGAVSAASIFHFTECTPAQVKEYLRGTGIPVRRSYRELHPT